MKLKEDRKGKAVTKSICYSQEDITNQEYYTMVAQM